ncbi:hypothetical protein PIB30_047888 [Stylosanthes scabra]|uniref:Uncharacterized protein n=1 Tax=Stylosanthes scabra TaxID=79078 RepID=A0ABU6YHZ1_9FABA|nr:hypothetical protein [Stylosanthes scabra]
MPWPPVNNPLPDGEEEDIAMEEEIARQAGRVYLRWDGGGLQEVEASQQEEHGVLDGWITSYRGAPPRTRPPERGWYAYMYTFSKTVTASDDVNDAFIAELKRLQEGRQAIINAGGLEPPDRQGRENDDIASGPPNLREQEVSELRKVYSDMYSFLTQMWSNGSSAAAMPNMPPPPPPLPPPA